MTFTPESPSKFSVSFMSLSSTSFLFLTAEQTHTALIIVITHTTSVYVRNTM